MRLTIFLIITLTCFSSLLLAQLDTSVHLMSVDDRSFAQDSFAPIHIEFRSNTVFESINLDIDNFYYWEMQNVLRISIPLRLADYSTKAEFRSGLSGHVENRMKPEYIKYFHNKAPYTKLRFLTTLNNGQLVGLLHSQNISPRWNMTIEFLKGKSEGFFQFEAQKYDRIGISSLNYGKGGKYELKSYVFLNTERGDENGGLANDTAFINNEITDRSVVPVNLNSARLSFKQFSLGLEQSFLIHGNRLDSLGIPDYSKQKLFTGIGHALTFLQESFGYGDLNPTSGYYENVFLDSIATADSAYFRRLENKIAFFKKADRTFFEFGPVYEIAFWNYGFMNETSQRLRLYSKLEHDFGYGKLSSSLDYTILGNGIGSGLLALNFSKDFGGTRLLMGGCIARDFQNLIFHEYNGNHLKWEDEDVPLNEIFKTFLGLKHDNGVFSTRVELGFENQSARAFFTSSGVAKFQNVSSLYSEIDLKLKLGVFVFDNKIFLNKTNAPMPSIIGRHAVYYESYWFSKAMLMRIGTKLKYTDSYVSQTFSPSIGQFTLQGENETEVSFYPYFDVFLNFKVRTFELYLAVQHFTQGFFGYDYFAVPHYTLPERAIRLGITWSFSN